MEEDRKEWYVKITKTGNGFLVEYMGGDNDMSMVYQEKESVHFNEENYEHYVEMFYEIMEYFGDFFSKHRKKNIDIKYQDTELIT